MLLKKQSKKTPKISENSKKNFKISKKSPKSPKKIGASRRKSPKKNLQKKHALRAEKLQKKPRKPPKKTCRFAANSKKNSLFWRKNSKKKHWLVDFVLYKLNLKQCEWELILRKTDLTVQIKMVVFGGLVRAFTFTATEKTLENPVASMVNEM